VLAAGAGLRGVVLVHADHAAAYRARTQAGRNK